MPDDDEYIVASEHVRHQDNICFAHMTLFATITGALIAFKYRTPTPEPSYLSGIAGILTSLSFWTNMEIYMYRYHVFLKRAVSLEKKLHFSLYSPMLESARKIRPGSWSWRFLFAGVTIFWQYDVLTQLGWLLPVASFFGAALFTILIQLALLLGKLSKKDESAPWWA